MSAPAASAASHPPATTDTPSAERFGRLADKAQVERTLAALRENGMNARLVADRDEAVRAVLELIPDGSNVLDASSQTLVALGLDTKLTEASRFHSLRPELTRLRQGNQPDALRKLGAAPDVIVGSVHAITEKGQAVIASASGSQLAPYASGAGRVIWVVGTQKIVRDLGEAFQRLEQYTVPREDERAMKAYGVHTFLAKLLVVHREFQPGRIHVLLVPENLGF